MVPKVLVAAHWYCMPAIELSDPSVTLVITSEPSAITLPLKATRGAPPLYQVTVGVGEPSGVQFSRKLPSGNTYVV